MKRTKMISGLADYIRRRDDSMALTLEMRKLIAGWTLDYVEKQGMAPPCLPPEKCQELMKKYVDPNFRKWEPEDDEVR